MDEPEFWDLRLALENPEALDGEVPVEDEDDLTAEGMWHVAHALYAEAFGEDMPTFPDLARREMAGNRGGG